MLTYTYIYTYIHTYICIHIYIDTYMHACLHTYIHTCTHTYIHTYIHAYIQTHTSMRDHTAFILSRTHAHALPLSRSLHTTHTHARTQVVTKSIRNFPKDWEVRRNAFLQHDGYLQSATLAKRSQWRDKRAELSKLRLTCVSGNYTEDIYRILRMRASSLLIACFRRFAKADGCFSQS
jgi:hypothetical protein